VLSVGMLIALFSQYVLLAIVLTYILHGLLSRVIGIFWRRGDATQEAFFKAYRSLRTFKPGAKFSTWIFAIVYHACCDRLNRRKRYSNEELPERADPGPGPEREAIAADEAKRLRAAIDALPEKYRAVITLYHLQGRQYEEIAEVLGIPLGTVKTHLFRAKEHLRKLLSDETLSEARE